MKIRLFSTFSTLILLFTTQSFAQVSTPNCLSGGQELLINNEIVLQWKHTTQNQYHNRAHVQGTLVKVYPDHSGHHHYEVQIGANPSDLIEVIYNEQFGAVPNLQSGASFEACGDYITSNKPTGNLPASLDGAIIHWVHKSPNPQSHDSGFMLIDGIVYGEK